MMPSRNSTFAALMVSAFARALASMSGVMSQPPSLFRAVHFLRGDERIESRTASPSRAQLLRVSRPQIAEDYRSRAQDSLRPAQHSNHHQNNQLQPRYLRRLSHRSIRSSAAAFASRRFTIFFAHNLANVQQIFHSIFLFHGLTLLISTSYYNSATSTPLPISFRESC